MTLLFEKVREGYPDPFPMANQGKEGAGLPSPAQYCSAVCLSVVFTFMFCLFSAHISHTHVGKLAVMQQE